MKLLLITFIFSIFNFTTDPIDKEDAQIAGIWLSPKKEIKIQIFEKNNAYYGKIIWIKKGSAYSKYAVDAKNPKPSLRQRPLIGLTILNNFKYDQQKMDWEHGCIYHPKYGKTFRGKMALKDAKTLKITGYWGVLKDSGIWTRP